ncbi:MAG: AAA family ATPase [Bacteroidales bacterium]|nr:AAA family ATPase [Bacteroidales bacterium]
MTTFVEKKKNKDMLYRKYAQNIETFLKTQPNKILLVNGARQIGKSYIIRYVGQKLFRNFIEINLKEDSEGDRVFSKVNSLHDFHLQLSSLAGDRLGTKEDTLVFLDEIQSYPKLLTMLKFLNQEGRFTYIASGSQLGVALSQTPSVPIGSVAIEEMYPLDFEEFLIAMGCGANVVDEAKRCFEQRESLSEALHDYMLRQFKNYLLIGGLPEVVNTFISTRNIVLCRRLQQYIHDLYRIDASQHDEAHKLMIRRIYDMVPSNLESKKKRVIIKDIEGKKGHRSFADYADEFEYLTASGIALEVKAVSNPSFPLLETGTKNLLKLYLNDVGILTKLLYGNNINAILQDERSVNLGTVYESVVAQELHAHGFPLYYYDNKKNGEVDYLVDDYESLSVLPLEIKSGKDYKKHSALDRFLSAYNIERAIVFSNEREVTADKGLVYMPIYFCMFLNRDSTNAGDLIMPAIAAPEV